METSRTTKLKTVITIEAYLGRHPKTLGERFVLMQQGRDIIKYQNQPKDHTSNRRQNQQHTLGIRRVVAVNCKIEHGRTHDGRNDRAQRACDRLQHRELIHNKIRQHGANHK